jgi:hypothetical protein
MVQEISGYDPLVGPKLGEKRTFVLLSNYDFKQAKFDEIKLKFENSKGFNNSSSISFYKIPQIHAKSFQKL